MKPNFVKLDLNIDLILKKTLDIEFFNAYSTTWQKYTAALKKEKEFNAVPVSKYIVKNHVEEALSIFPEELLAIERPEFIMNILDPTDTHQHSMVGPHRDFVRKCAVNFYLNPIGEETKYYLYAGGKVTQVDSFIAKQNECWLINTDIPHSVDLKPNHIRKILSFSFINTPFEKVSEYFE
jgi:hypothetical protein